VGVIDDVVGSGYVSVIDDVVGSGHVSVIGDVVGSFEVAIPKIMRFLLLGCYWFSCF